MRSRHANAPNSADGRLDRRRGGLAEAADRGVAHRLRRSRRSAPARPAPCRACAPDSSRASASCWRTVPTRQGTHWPQLSLRKNAAITMQQARRGRRVSSMASTTPEPSVAPDSRASSSVSAQVEVLGRDEPAGRAAEQDRLQVAAGRRRRARAARAAWCRTGPRRCRAARPRRETQNSFGPVELLGADLGERRAALEHDRQHVDERLDVVDHRRLPEQALDDRERRLVARLAAVALDRAEDRGLLAADVGAGALAQLDVEGEAVRRARPRRGSRARGPGVDRVARCRCWRERVLAADVEVAVLAAGRVARRSSSPRSRANGSPSMITRSLNVPGLGLVGVADQVVRAPRLARDGVPLRPIGNAAPPRPTSVRVDHLADHALGPEVDRPAQRVVAAVGAVVVEALGVDERRRGAAAAGPGRRAAAASVERAAVGGRRAGQDRLRRRRRRPTVSSARAAASPASAEQRRGRAVALAQARAAQPARAVRRPRARRGPELARSAPREPRAAAGDVVADVDHPRRPLGSTENSA